MTNTMLAQIFDVEAIKISGDNDKRINLIILSEGYTAAQLPQFIADANSFTSEMFSQSPFAEYSNYFNVYAIKVPSNESGADHPGTATDTSEPASPIIDVDTYFNATFDAFGFHRLLYYGIDFADASSAVTKINSVLADNFPTYDQALILVNSTVYGGSGGEFPIASRAASANEIAIHELGHSLFNLKDEYYPGDALASEAINMTQETNPSLVKWKNWLGTNGVDIYPYATSGNAANWNRPHQNCKMRYLGVPFCAVCKEGIVEKIHDLVSPINSFTPVSNALDNPSLPIDFNLTLINPIPNTLNSDWTLNGANFSNNSSNISLSDIDLVEGFNALTAVVTDNNAALLRVDNHEITHVYTVSWSINYSALSINDITSETNTYSISMYPNPAENLLNLKVESSTESRLKIDIIALDGKKIKTKRISNYQNNQIDISNLSSGIYVTNFYANNVLISSRKLVKE